MKEDKMVDVLAAPKDSNMLDDPYIREQEMNIKTDQDDLNQLSEEAKP